MKFIEKTMTIEEFIESYCDCILINHKTLNSHNAHNYDYFGISKMYLKDSTFACQTEIKFIMSNVRIVVRYKDNCVTFFKYSTVQRLLEDENYRKNYGAMYQKFYIITLSDIEHCEIVSCSLNYNVFKLISSNGESYIFKQASDKIEYDKFQTVFKELKDMYDSNFVNLDEMKSESEILDYMLANSKPLDYKFNKINSRTWDEVSVTLSINSHGKNDYKKSLEEVRQYSKYLAKFAKESLLNRNNTANLLDKYNFLYLYKIRFHRDFTLRITFRIKGCDYDQED